MKKPYNEFQVDVVSLLTKAGYIILKARRMIREEDCFVYSLWIRDKPAWEVAHRLVLISAFQFIPKVVRP